MPRRDSARPHPRAVRQDGGVIPHENAPQPDIAELLDLAVRAATSAAAMIRDGRPETVEVAATKTSAVDVVTAMDTASEAHLRELLLAARPDDGFLGEEGGDVAGTSGVTWVVDPVDGTVNYLYGIPAYAVSVAAVAGPPDPASWTVLAGCVCSAADGTTWSAGRGMGARRDGRELRLGAAPSLAQSLVGTGFGYAAERRAAQARVLAGLLHRVRDVRRIGSAALDLCRIADGQLDLYYERGLNPWDMAAGSLIAEEAGAVVVGLRGARPGVAMTVAGADPTVRELIAILEELGADTGA